MRSIKKTTPFSFLLSLIAFGFTFIGLQNKAQAQADDLMIVEYVDWNGGSGFAIKIYNPTPNPINLTDYKLRIFSDARVNVFNDSDLLGILAPCATAIIGNDQYKNNNCTGSVNPGFFTPFTQGVNGNDLPAIIKMNGAAYTIVDMIGRLGFDPGNGNSQRIGTTNDALFEKRIFRNQNNQARYTLSSGTYNPAILTGPNIWPNNTTTIVQGWTVVGAGSPANGCLSAGLPPTWNMPQLALNLSATSVTVPCAVVAPNTITLPVATASGMVGPSGTNGVITWSGGSGTFIPGSSIAQPYLYVPGPSDPQQITLTVTGTFMCLKQTQQVTITNGTPPPVVNTVSTINDCPQDSILLAPTWLINPVFEWRTSNGKGTFKYNGTGATYYFPVASDFKLLKFHAVIPGCNSMVIGRREIQNGRDTLESPSGFTFAPQFPNINEPVTFSYNTNRPQSDFFGNWLFGDGTTVIKQQGSQQHSYPVPGTYTITVNVMDAFDCPRGTFTKQIIVMDPTPPVPPIDPVIPTLFTPNADNLNDVYRPLLPATSAYEIKIFNRWGQLVFESDTQEKAWDGKNVSDGVYFVYLKATYVNGETLNVRTPVTLVR